MASGGSLPAFDGVHVPGRTRLLFFAVTLLTLAVYLFAARGLPTTLDEKIIFDSTGSLVHGKATIDTQFLKIPALAGLAVKRSDGRQAGIYGIGTSAVGAPFYVVGKIVAELSPKSNRAQALLTATMFTNALLTAAAMFVLMLLCMLLGAPPPGAVLVGLSYALGSYAFPHAVTLFTEPGTALCVIAAVLFAVRASRGWARGDLIACGAFAGGALLFRVSAALFLPVFGLWILFAAWRSHGLRRKVVEAGAWYTAGAAGPLLLLLAVNWWRYGSPTNFGYALGTATSQSYPIVRGVAGQWLSSGKSIFLYAPIALVVVAGLVRSFKKRPMEMSLLASIVVVNTLFFARVQFWSGDWAWGPRYLQIVVPCLAAMAAPLMDSRAWRRALIGVSVLGLLFAALPAVLVRFTLVFWAAQQAMPPKSAVLGPPVWDHSYYALVWHTLHWQQMLYQLRSLPHAIANTFDHVTNAHGPTPVNQLPSCNHAIPSSCAFTKLPRFEFWWLRARDIGWTAVVMFTVFPVAAAAGGIAALRRYRRSAPESTGDATGASTVVAGAVTA